MKTLTFQVLFHGGFSPRRFCSGNPHNFSLAGRGFALLVGALLSACASTVPEPIRKAPAQGPQVAEVRQSPERFMGSRVRWGGTIVRTEIQASETWIELVGRELDSEGEPRETDSSSGRFLARIEGFLEPTIYAKGRQLTVVGQVAATHVGEIDKTTYLYPIVHVEHHYLWPLKLQRYCPDCDPLMHPPWYPYPYRPYYW